MAVRQITYIRLLDNLSSSNKKITHLKFLDGSVESVGDTIENIKRGDLYYYKCSDGQSPTVEVVVSCDKHEPYIKTRFDLISKDRLLKLPKF